MITNSTRTPAARRFASLRAALVVAPHAEVAVTDYGFGVAVRLPGEMTASVLERPRPLPGQGAVHATPAAAARAVFRPA